MQELPQLVADSLLRLVDMQRFAAHLVIDEAQVLVRSGGHLDHYGLAELEIGATATEQLPFMEGMLPLVETPFLIRSLEMPSAWQASRKSRLRRPWTPSGVGAMPRNASMAS